jgi:4-amino-4-deoxy-L-arabinose transferase-like glycosyltransferase
MTSDARAATTPLTGCADLDMQGGGDLDHREGQAMFPRVTRRATAVILGILVAQFLALGLYEAWHDAPTYDEAFALSTGVTALTRHQLQVTSGHPPLPEVLATVPVLAARPVIPSGPNWRNGSALYANDFVNAQADAGKLREVVFLGRLIPLLEAAFVALLLYVLGKALFARSAGLLAAGVWLTLPFTVGLGHINGDDIPFTVVTLLVSLGLLRYIRTRSRTDAVLLGVACGLSLLTRLIALAVVPAVALVVVAIDLRQLRRAAIAAATVLVIAWASVWIGYRAVSPFPNYRHSAILVVPGQLQDGVRLALKVPWPREYQDNIRDQARVTKVPAPAYLLGRSWRGIRWWYWPGSVLVKLPLSTLALMAAGVLGWWRLGRDRILRALLVLGLPAAAVTAFVVPEPRQLGLRYLLPALALGLVAAGPAVRIFSSRRPLVRGLAFGCLGLVALAQLAWLWEAVPHSLAWTAPPFRPGYQVAADSNLDWGQDLYALARFGERKRIAVDYFGTVDPTLLIDGATQLRADPPVGWVAVSASQLTTWKGDELSWLRAYCPVRVINGTILVYRFDHPPDRSPGPMRPTSKCSGGTSRRR